MFICGGGEVGVNKGPETRVEPGRRRKTSELKGSVESIASTGDAALERRKCFIVDTLRPWASKVEGASWGHPARGGGGRAAKTKSE